MKDINILAADTSGVMLAAAILKNDIPIAVCNKNTGLTHSETLMPEIIRLFELTQLKPTDIDFYVCTNGPGSFTGLRIGIAALKGLAHVSGKPMVEVGTLDGLYTNIRNENSVICPIIDARREEVYTTVYKNGEKILKDTSFKLTELTDFLTSLKTKVLFNGDGAKSYKDRIIELMGKKAIFASEEAMLQNSISVGICGLEKIKQGNIKNYNNFSVMYLKPSQPEMNMNGKLKMF